MARPPTSNNQSVSSQDELRRELETKIDKKLDGIIFWTILAILAGSTGIIYFWLMNMNERVTRVETRLDYPTQPFSIQTPPIPTTSTQPVKK